MCNCGKTRQTGGSNNNNSNYYNTPKPNNTNKERPASTKDFEKSYREMLYGRSK